MALFKKKLSLDDILEGINNLSEEEKGKVMAMLGKSADTKEETPAEVESVEETTSDSEPVDKTVEEVKEGTEETTEETESEVAEENSESEEAIETAPVEESEVEPVAEESTEETEIVEEQPEEPVEEVAPEVQKQNEELDASQNAKLQALEERVAKSEEMIARVLEMLDNKDFGLNPGVPEGGGEDHNRMSAVMRGYAGGHANKYL